MGSALVLAATALAPLTAPTVARGLDTVPDQAEDWNDVGQLNIELGPPGSWDDGWIQMRDVIQRGDTYYLYYTGGTTQDCSWESGLNNHTAGGVATSTDGVHFVKHAGNPIVTATDFGEDGVESEEGIRLLSVTYDSLRDLFILYAGQEHANGALSTCDWQVDAHVDLATSTDGIHFTSQGLVDCEHNGTFGMEFYPSEAVYVEALDTTYLWTHCAECTGSIPDHTTFANSASGSSPNVFDYLGVPDENGGTMHIGSPFVHDDNNTVTMVVFDKPASETYFVTTHLDNPTQLSDKRVLFHEFKENGHSLLKDTGRNQWMWYFNDKPYAGFSGYRIYLRTAPLADSAPSITVDPASGTATRTVPSSTTGTECGSDSECDDADPCTDDICRDDTCINADNDICHSDAGPEAAPHRSLDGGCATVPGSPPSFPILVLLFALPLIAARRPT